jgi:hypothetical protein
VVFGIGEGVALIVEDEDVGKCLLATELVFAGLPVTEWCLRSGAWHHSVTGTSRGDATSRDSDKSATEPHDLHTIRAAMSLRGSEPWWWHPIDGCNACYNGQEGGESPLVAIPVFEFQVGPVVGLQSRSDVGLDDAESERVANIIRWYDGDR